MIKIDTRGASLFLSACFALLGCAETAAPDAPPTDTVSSEVTSVLSWKGLTWNLTSGGMAGVAQGSPANVSVDASGYLHLKITKTGATWTAAEMFTSQNLGFGTYQWQIDGPVDRMDPSVVLGLFPYGPAAGIGADGTNELDQEFSFWGQKTGTNFGWTFYPASGATIGENDFKFSLDGGTAVTSRMVWSSTSVTGSLLSGFQPVSSDAGLIESWTYAPANPGTNVPQKALPLGMNLWCFEQPPASGQTVEIVIRDFQFIPAGTVADGNIAGSGTGYLWSKNSTATANANRVASAGVNDGNLTTSVLLNAAGEGGLAKWEAAGVVWPSARTIASAKFVNGAIDADGNGYFESGARLQLTTDGTTWADSGWAVSPAYPGTSAAAGQTYTFSGATKSGVRGARITGQTGANSWSWAIREAQFIGH